MATVVDEASGGEAPAGAGALPPVPHDGVSLAALRAFAKAHNSRSFGVRDDAKADKVTRRFEELTSKQVVEAVIKPATQAAGASGADCTYAELLLAQVSRARQRQTHGCVLRRADRWPGAGERRLARAAPCGACHSLSEPRLGVRLRRPALCAGAARRGRTRGGGRVFLDRRVRACGTQRRRLLLPRVAADLFVVGQHEAAVLPAKWWSDTFQQAVAGIGHTVLVLQPWNAPLPLTRSWCLVRAARCGIRACPGILMSFAVGDLQHSQRGWKQAGCGAYAPGQLVLSQRAGACGHAALCACWR